MNNFEFLVCKRQGFVVLRLDDIAERTFYFIDSISFKLLFTDWHKNLNNVNSSLEGSKNMCPQDENKNQNICIPATNALTLPRPFSSDTPLITNTGCEFYIQQREGFILLSQDNLGHAKFSFTDKLAFKLLFTDNKSSVIVPVNQIPLVHKVQQTPGNTSSMHELMANVTKNKVSEPQSNSCIRKLLTTPESNSCIRKLSTTPETCSTSISVPILHGLSTTVTSLEPSNSMSSTVNNVVKCPERQEHDFSSAFLLKRFASHVKREAFDKKSSAINQINVVESRDTDMTLVSTSLVDEILTYTCTSNDTHPAADVPGPLYSRSRDLSSLEASKNKVDVMDASSQDYKPKIEDEDTVTQTTDETLILEVEFDDKYTGSRQAKGILDGADMQQHWHSLGDSYRSSMSEEETDSTAEGTDSQDERIVQRSGYKGSSDLKFQRASSNKSSNYVKLKAQVNKKMDPVKRERRQATGFNRQSRQVTKMNKRNTQGARVSKQRSRTNVLGRQSTGVAKVNKLSNTKTSKTNSRDNRILKKVKDEDYIPDQDEEEDSDSDIDNDEENAYDEIANKVKCPPKPPEKKGKHPCDKCGEIFEYSSKLKKHKRKVHPVLHPCNVCKEVFQLAAHLTKHKKVAHPAMYVCEICDEVFKHYVSYIKHKTTHKGAFSCDICGEDFQKNYWLLKHKRDVHDVKFKQSYLCELCGKCLRNMKKHKCTARAVPTKRSRYSCWLCKKRYFKTSALLNQHLRQRHLNDRDSAGRKILKPCPDCDMVFRRETRFLAHAKSHVPAECDKCGRQFKNSSYLKLHLRHHIIQAVMEHICHCGSKFESRKSLLKHKQRQHSLKMKYKCEDCCRSFSNLAAVGRHMLSHTGVQSFACSVCHKHFSLAYNLTVHMRRHTNEKPFKCNFCATTFAHKCSLLGHLKAKHSEMLKNSL